MKYRVEVLEHVNHLVTVEADDHDIARAVAEKIVNDLPSPQTYGNHTRSVALVECVDVEQLPPKLAVGARYRLKRDVERFPHFIADAGLTGVIEHDADEYVALKMDQPLDGAEEWDNCVIWMRSDDEPLDDIEPVEANEITLTFRDAAALDGYIAMAKHCETTHREEGWKSADDWQAFASALDRALLVQRLPDRFRELAEICILDAAEEAADGGSGAHSGSITLT